MTHRLARHGCALALLLSLGTPALHAQTAVDTAADRAPTLQALLTPGRTVRLHLFTGRTLSGRITRPTDSVATIRECAACAERTYRVQVIGAVDTMIGKPRRGRHVLLGALLGGGAAVAAVAVAGTQEDRNCHDGPCGLWVVAVPPAFFVGALAGGVAGVLVPSVRWAPVRFAMPVVSGSQ